MAAIPLASLQPRSEVVPNGDDDDLRKEPSTRHDDEDDSGKVFSDAQDPLLESDQEESVEHHAQNVPSSRQASIYWLVPVYLLYTLGYGGVWVPKLDLIYNLTCRAYCLDHDCSPAAVSGDVCRAPDIQGYATEFVLVCNLLGGIISIFTSPKFTESSDRYGRTRILAIGGTGMLVNYVLTILVAAFPDTFPLPWLYMTYVFESILGPYASITAIAQAYATDITAPAERNVAFGYLNGCLYVGMAIGPSLAALALSVTGSMVLIFWLALFGIIMFMLSMEFIVPESLDMQRRTAAWEAFSLRKAQNSRKPWYTQLQPRTMFASLRTLWPTGAGSSPALRRNLVFLAATDTVLEGVMRSSFSIIVYYSTLRFGWDTSEKSLFQAAIQSVRGVGLMLVLPILTRWFIRPKQPMAQEKSNRGCDAFDIRLIRLNTILNMLGWLGYALAPSPLLFVASGVLLSIAGIGRPVLQSAMTKHVPPSQTSLLLGAIAMLYGVMRVLSPIVMNGFYSATVGILPQAIFAALSMVCGVLAVASWVLRPGVFLDNEL